MICGRKDDQPAPLLSFAAEIAPEGCLPGAGDLLNKPIIEIFVGDKLQK